MPLELPQEGGTTATVLLLHGGGLLAAWVGDSRAVLGEVGAAGAAGWTATEVTHDHNVLDEAERTRLLAAGGKTGKDLYAQHVYVPGSEGTLKLTRSLGDSPFHKGEAVSAKPGVRHLPLTAAARFVIVASDGIWDHLDNQRAVEVVGSTLEAHEAFSGGGGAATAAAAAACDAVLDHIAAGQADGSMKPGVDDRSIVVLLLRRD